MNKLYIAALAAGALLLPSCANNDQPENAPQDNTYSGFMTLNFSLPVDNGTRTDPSNDGKPEGGYDDGDAAEYDIKNGKLVLYQLASPESLSQVIFVTDIPTGTSEMEGTTTDNITKSYKVSVEVKNINKDFTDNQYGVMAILNYGNNFPIPEVGSTLEEYMTTATDRAGYYTEGTETYFTMTNALTFDRAADLAITGFKSLVPVPRSAIVPTLEGQTLTPVDIYVQRVVAKVTLQNSTNTFPINTSDQFNGDHVDVNGYAMDMTNKTTYPLQTVGTQGDALKSVARLFGSETEFSRFYWAVDPNYTSATAADFDNIELTSTFNAFNTETSKWPVSYVRENTFNTDNMNQDQTTRMVIKATYKLQNNAAETIYRVGNLHLVNATGFKTDIVNAASSLGKTITADDITLPTTAGTKKFSDITIANMPSDLTMEALAKAFGAKDADAAVIAVYENGLCYYPIRLRHFNDTQTPWENNEDYTEARHLGRYGVVRNNWYQVTINAVSGPGLPDVPPTPPTPDDEKKYYMNASIKILSWAKRPQSVTL